MLNKIITTLVLMAPVAVFAKSSGHASVSDLIYPFINVVILFGFLIYKLKQPMSEMFTNNSNKIQELASLADEKDKQAESELKTLNAKLSSLEMEIKSILSDAHEDGEKFDKSHSLETKDQVSKFRKDAEQKLLSEKSELVRKINSNLLDQVINGAKATIKSDVKLQDKATSQMMSGF